MLQHLLDIDEDAFQTLEAADVRTVADAMIKTHDWMDELGVPRAEAFPSQDADDVARKAFAALTTPGADEELTKAKLLALRTPQSTQQLAAMLSSYDWAFVEHAAQIRGYVVAKLLEHAENTNPKTSLQALKLLGSVTEVGSFTERVEVTKRTVDETEITQRLRERLLKLMPTPPGADAPVTDVTEKHPDIT